MAAAAAMAADEAGTGGTRVPGARSLSFSPGPRPVPGEPGRC